MAVMEQLGRVEVGVSAVDISPVESIYLGGYGARTAPSVATHDALFATSVAFRGETENAIVVAVDTLGLSTQYCERVSGEIGRRLGLPSDHVIITSSHTHSAPAVGNSSGANRRYLAELSRGVIDSALAAFEASEPAVLRRGRADLPDVARNRRGGKSTDPVVHAIAIDTKAGGRLATIFSYACHPVTLGPDNLQVTADWPGYARRAIEAHDGGVALFLQGCAGQLNTGHSAHASFEGVASRERTFARAQEIGFSVASAVAGAEWSEPSTSSIAVRSRVVLLPLGPRQPAAEIEGLVAEWRRAERIATPGIARVLQSWIAWAHRLPDMETITAVPARVSAIGWPLGRIVFLPGEPFVDIALDAQRILGEPEALIVGYANGVPGYIPYPPSEYALGGYEVAEAHRGYMLPAAFAPEAGELLLACGVDLGWQVVRGDGT